MVPTGRDADARHSETVLAIRRNRRLTGQSVLPMPGAGNRTIEKDRFRKRERSLSGWSGCRYSVGMSSMFTKVASQT